MKRIVLTLLVLNSFSALAQTPLDEKLDSLNIPDDKVMSVISDDQLYAVNSRYSVLNKRHEVTLFGANNFNSDSHLETQEGGATYRFHMNDTVSFGLRYTQYKNTLSDAGETLHDKESLLPDTDYAHRATDLFVNFNTIYGKMRLTKKRVLYFDQYIALGYGNITLASGETKLINLDLGFSFWVGKNWSARAGLRNEFYTQKQKLETRDIHNAIGYLEVGYLFGAKA